ncbi:MAG: glycogen debranching enzyme N-terminal domain-containing protein, partial [Planctomycetes bacterium]|nr:glycogen debranching enzyme N-terminal domain-containing protein [Planctomycetota bacterium]
DASGLQCTTDSNHTLTLRAGPARFLHQPYWNEAIHFSEDAQRGLDHTADTFSPGVFQATLKKGETISITLAAQPIDKPLSFQKTLTAHSRHTSKSIARIPAEPARNDPIIRILTDALDQFIINSPDGHVLLSGFPWLGQKSSDSLQCIPALLAIGRIDTAKDILIQTAKTERHGLLKDWLNNGSDTYTGIESPLRLALATDQFINVEGNPQFLDQPIDATRTLRQIIQSIFENFTSTTQSPCLDPDTGLLWCPPGSTWMNTTDPQATQWKSIWIDKNGMAAEDLRLADLNGDNKIDIIAAGRATHNLKIYWNQKDK